MRSYALTIGLSVCLLANLECFAQDNVTGNTSGQQGPTSGPPTSAPPTELSGGGFSPPISSFNPASANAQSTSNAQSSTQANPNDSGQSFDQLLNRATNSPSQRPLSNPSDQQQGSQVQPYKMQSGGTLEPAQASDPPNIPNQHGMPNGQTGQPSFYQNGNRDPRTQQTDNSNLQTMGSGVVRQAGFTETGQQQDQLPNSQFGSGSGFNPGSAVNNNSNNQDLGGRGGQFSNQNQINSQGQMGDQNRFGNTDQYGNQNGLRSAALPFGNQGGSNNGLPTNNAMTQNNSMQNNSMQNSSSSASSNLQQLVNEFDVISVQGQLPGVPKTLIEVIASTPTHRHAQVSVAYWELFEAWAKYRRANDWASRLHTISEPQVQAERTLINAARSASLNEVKQSENTLRSAQRKLASMVPAMQNNSQILPADLPLVGNYETRYDHFASQRQFDVRYARIHQQLPEIRSLMNNQANTVMQFNQAYAQVMQGYSGGQMPISSVLETIRLAREQDNKLIESITQYNQSIAHYAFYVAPGAQSPEKIVKMLIKISPGSMEMARQAGLVQQDTSIRQATLNEQVPNSYSQGSNSFAPPSNSQIYR